MTDAEFALILEKLHEAFSGPGGPMDRLEDLPERLAVEQRPDGKWNLLSNDKSVGGSALWHPGFSEVLAKSPLWLIAALKEIQVLQGIIHDMQQDGGVQQGRAEYRNRVFQLLRENIAYHKKQCEFHRVHSHRDWARDEEAFAAVLENMLIDLDAPTDDSLLLEELPPHAAMNEILRLRAALRQIAAEGKGLTLTKIAREALGEEP